MPRCFLGNEEGIWTSVGKWPGLTREAIEEIGNRFEAACVVAMKRAAEAEPNNKEAAAAKFNKMRTGISRPSVLS